eukprot:6023894-Pyramimonas_sp.AAC.2
MCTTEDRTLSTPIHRGAKALAPTFEELKLALLRSLSDVVENPRGGKGLEAEAEEDGRCPEDVEGAEMFAARPRAQP